MDNNIHNWYEFVVFEKLKSLDEEDTFSSEEEISDIACVALNHLPARYIRHAVDVSFYTSSQERQDITNRVDKAVNNAIEFVRQNFPKPD